MSDLNALLKAKIPCPETGIEIRHGICDICSPSFHCGINAYVKDGEIVKVEGNPDHPVNHGLLCTKGMSNRAYIYREDRVLTPLKRVGERGEGRFQPISWEEAYTEIARRLNEQKEKYGPESVVFFSGYDKWYRMIFERFAYSFGSPNYGSESSTCFTSGLMAWKTATGLPARADMGKCDLFLGWAFNGYYSRYLVPPNVLARKEAGTKVIIIDPRVTPATYKLADLHLAPRPGTDGALALAIAAELIANGWIDKPYIEKYVHGFPEYADYVRQFAGDEVERLTGVPYAQVRQAAQMIHDSSAMCVNESSAPIGHHKNGMQNYRAIMSLLAITGNYDRAGGQMPAEHTYIHVSSGFLTKEHQFVDAARPKNAPLPIGAPRFPLWNHMERQMQSTDLSRQIMEGTPYPVHSIFALGMNMRMFPDSPYMLEALKSLEFFVDTDLFLTDTAKYADIVLPACSSLERGEFKTYPAGRAIFTTPVIPPRGSAKSDVDILCELAGYLDLKDDLLRSGYEACIRHIISDLHITVEELKAFDVPKRIPDFSPELPMARLEAGLPTPTGKFELKSELIAAHPEWGLDALPTYVPPVDEESARDFPMLLCAGSRIPNAIHSRLHDVKWERALRPIPAAEISVQDAQALDIQEGDHILISTSAGSMEVAAQISNQVSPGQVFMFHGYREADVNQLIHRDNLDPYCGFPAFRSTACKIAKKE